MTEERNRNCKQMQAKNHDNNCEEILCSFKLHDRRNFPFTSGYLVSISQKQQHSKWSLVPHFRPDGRTNTNALLYCCTGSISMQ